MKRLQLQQGFTLIELIVVILILGILAATALPRYINAQADARAAKAQGIYGAVRSASALAAARCQLDLANTALTSTCNAVSGGSVTMEGQNVTMVYGYPDASTAGILTAAQLSATNDSLDVTTGFPPLIEIKGASDPANCYVSYAAATATAATPPVITAPAISVKTTGC